MWSFSYIASSLRPASDQSCAQHSADAVRVLVRYRLERVVGVELFKLVDEVSLFAVFFPGEVGKILGLVHVVGNVRLLDGGEAKFLPQLAERVLGNKAHRQPCADRLAQRAHPVAQTALARRQQIVVLAAVPRSSRMNRTPSSVLYS